MTQQMDLKVYIVFKLTKDYFKHIPFLLYGLKYVPILITSTTMKMSFSHQISDTVCTILAIINSAWFCQCSVWIWRIPDIHHPYGPGSQACIFLNPLVMASFHPKVIVCHLLLMTKNSCCTHTTMSCTASVQASHPLSYRRLRNLQLTLPHTRSPLASCRQPTPLSFLGCNKTLAYGLLRHMDKTWL